MRVKQIKNCLNCECEFFSVRNDQTFCSTKCRKQYDTRIRRQKLLENVYKCRFCGEVFIPPRGNTLYCSPACRTRANTKYVCKTKLTRSCVYCKEEFTTFNRQQQFCKKSCGVRWHKENYKKLGKNGLVKKEPYPSIRLRIEKLMMDKYGENAYAYNDYKGVN